ncbi:MAG: TolC family protein [Planctomycetaceae bacterium]
MLRHTGWRSVVATCLAGLGFVLWPAARAVAQDAAQQRQNPILEFPDLGPIRGTTEPAPLPGSLAPSMDLGGTGVNTPAVLGGKRRSGRLPKPGKQRAAASTIAATRGLQLPEPLPLPAAGGGAAPGAAVTTIDTALIDDVGPAAGLTLDAALERMLAANLDIRALQHELTQADADVLTAGLRTNPLVYMDSQFIPYGKFDDAHPGGPTQYDVNVTMPLDVSRKRQARTVVARLARSTLEAQFQDVTRRQIDNVYRTFVTLQSARIDRLAAEATVRRQEHRLAELQARPNSGAGTTPDAIDHVAVLLERSRMALEDAVEAYDDAREGLGVLLSMPPAEAARLDPHGSLRDDAPPPPGLEELETLALKCRPDLRAARLGVGRAGAELALQRANRFDDIFLFYDPITIQDNSPYGQPSAQSWAMGLTFALPIFNRNQGNIARAESNIGQSQLELSSLERRALADVRLADRELRRSRDVVAQIERSILPRSKALLERHKRQFDAGDLSLDDMENAYDDLAEVSQSLRDAVVRHRRAMLELNTAVGLRILP